MKRWMRISMALLLLAGCGNKTSQIDAKDAAYEAYYQEILDNITFQDSSQNYSISTEIAQMDDGSYRYYVVLDDPQIAMYDVMVMCVENDVPFGESTKMMPSVGVMEDHQYSLIPFQSNPDSGYVKGLVISGESEASSIVLKLMVEWHNEEKDQVYREFLQLHVPEGSEASES